MPSLLLMSLVPSIYKILPKFLQNSGSETKLDFEGTFMKRAAEPVPPKGQSRWFLKHIEVQNKINAMRDALLGSDVRE